jgi:hypothetical protein
MTWAKTGWESVDEAEAEATKEFGPRDFWVESQKTKRIVMLDDTGFMFWEHGLYSLTKKVSDREICLLKNKIADNCPLCEAGEHDKELRLWPSFVGIFTVLDCGTVTLNPTTKKTTLEGFKSKKGKIYQFDKKILRAKKGSTEKPGMLPYIRRKKDARGGSLLGTVWDCYRAGDKTDSIGGDWEYVTTIDVSTPETLRAGLVSMNGSPLTNVHDDLIKDLDPTPLQYDKIFVPKTPTQLRRYLGGSAAHKPAEGAEGADGDIPF